MNLHKGFKEFLELSRIHDREVQLLLAPKLSVDLANERLLRFSYLHLEVLVLQLVDLVPSKLQVHPRELLNGVGFIVLLNCLFVACGIYVTSILPSPIRMTL